MPVPEPPWLKRYRDKPIKRKRDKDVIRYYSKIFRATPEWLTKAHRSEIAQTYRKASKSGMTVDHVVPLSSLIVCGLHVPWNLQIISRKDNDQKSNTWWPDCPYEQLNLYVPTAKISGLTFSEWVHRPCKCGKYFCAGDC